MSNSSKLFRLVIAASLFVLWTAWAIWANQPHYYDAQALEQEIAKLFPTGSAPKLEPASGGFPVHHMRYDFSRNGELTVHELSADKFELNVLLCALATLAITVLALRTTNVSRSTVTIAAWLLLPVCIARVLFGPHPLVIGYVYFLPLVLLTGSSLYDLFKSEKEQNQPTNREHRDTVLDN